VDTHSESDNSISFQDTNGIARTQKSMIIFFSSFQKKNGDILSPCGKVEDDCRAVSHYFTSNNSFLIWLVIHFVNGGIHECFKGLVIKPIV
jgi:hypothetical protein